MKTLVQELREQLERVVRDPYEPVYGMDFSNETECAVSAVPEPAVYADEDDPTQAWRIAILTAAIRAAVVTREAR